MFITRRSSQQKSLSRVNYFVRFGQVNCRLTTNTVVIDLLTGSETFLSSYNGDTNGSATLAYGDGVLYAMNATNTVVIDLLTGSETFLSSYNGDANGSAALAYSPTVVPVPSAVWLFGSGLIGLIGLARRKA